MVSVLLALIALSAAAEEFHIAPRLPVYKVTPIFDGSHIVDQLEIHRGGRRIQTLNECEVLDSPPKGETWLKTEDLNFDGYQDLLLMASWGATGNQSWCVWLFDGASSKFRYVPDFQLGAHKLNPQDKTILMSSHEGSVYTQKTVRFVNALPVVVAERRGSWDVSPSLIFSARPEKPRYAPGEPVTILAEVRNPGPASALFVVGVCSYTFNITGITRPDAVDVCAAPEAVVELPPGKSHTESVPLGISLTRPAAYRVKVTKQLGFAPSEFAAAETEVVIR